MAIPIFGATYNFNDQILPYGILFLAFINTDVFYLHIIMTSCQAFYLKRKGKV
jgi:hypothetical protein